jgi:hypothetical protein
MQNGYVIIAVIIGIVGCLLLTKITGGVGMICFACLVAIIARMKQADLHHAEMQIVLETINRKTPERQ